MNSARVEHRLAVLMAADVVGYSRLMGLDEEGTLAALKTARRELVDPKIDAHKGRILRTMGDGLLVEFDSVVDAVRCAVELQQAMPAHGAALPLDRRIRFRIAIDMGDVTEDGDIIHGDAVDVAARMEALAEPGGINVSDAVREEVRGRLDIDFRDLGEHKVERVARTVRVLSVVLDREGAAAAAKPRAATRPEKPSLAVLPFQNLGGGGEAEFFLDSVAEDLITELARARWFSVVARNTSFTYKGRGADSKQLGRELGVRYVVEGSLRKAGSRVRIGCQLVEAESGQHLWAERFDGTLEDSFDLQDKITETVIGATGPVLRLAEVERARRKSDATLDVYDLTLRALPLAFAETAADNDAAMRLLERVMQIDPRYPTANAFAAWCLQQRYLMKWPTRQVDDRETARGLARTAIAEGGDAPLALVVGGAVHAALTRDHDLALAAVDRAAMINPNAAAVLGFDALNSIPVRGLRPRCRARRKGAPAEPARTARLPCLVGAGLGASDYRPARGGGGTRASCHCRQPQFRLSLLRRGPRGRPARSHGGGCRRGAPPARSGARLSYRKPAANPLCRRGAAQARCRIAAPGPVARVTARKPPASADRTPPTHSPPAVNLYIPGPGVT